MGKPTSIWRRITARPARQPERPDFDLHEAARDRLWARAADNPRLADLLTEIERGRQRRIGDPS